MIGLSLPLAARSATDSSAAQPELSPSQPLPDAQLAAEQGPAPSDPTAGTPIRQAPKADDSDKSKKQPESASEVLEESTKGNGGRVLGVLPNYRTTNTKETYTPLRAKEKWLIAYHDTLDYTNFVLAAAFAGLHQADDAHPQFHQGIEGYARYYGTAYLDQSVGNFMTEGLFPVLLHEDPRYFRKGSGTFSSRLGFAVKQIFVTRTDAGGHRFNTSEWGGNALATAVQNVYYSDSRDAKDNLINWGTAVATDTASDILKEFWPDIKRKMFKKHTADQQAN